MQLLIDLRSGTALQDLAFAVKLATQFRDHESDSAEAPKWMAGNFTPEELANDGINLPSSPVSSAPAPGTVAPASAGVTPAVAGVELDANGVPWDARIHSDAAEKKTTKGVWKARKGVDDMTRTRIHNELLAVMAAKVGSVPSAAAGVLITPPGNPVNVPHQVAVPLPGNPDSFVVAPPPPANEAPTVLAPPPPTRSVIVPPEPIVAAVPTNFPELLVWVTAHHETNGGKLTAAFIDHVCKAGSLVDSDGNASIQYAAARPDLIDWLYQNFVQQTGA